LDDDKTGAAKIKTPRLKIGQPHLLRQALADLLEGLARIVAGRHIDDEVVAGIDRQLVIAGSVVEPGIVGRGGDLPLRTRTAALDKADPEIGRGAAKNQAEQPGGGGKPD